MEPYQIEYSQGFEKDFRKLDRISQKRCLFRIKKLSQNPLEDCRKVKAFKWGKFRIRLGKYRLRYDVENRVVILHSIKHRKNIY